MSYSRRELYAMGEPLGECVTRKEGGRVIYGGGGGGGPTQTTVTQSNVPDWLRPQVENVLMGAGKQLFQTQKTQTGTDENGKPIYTEDIVGTKPFTPYSSDPSKYVAGFSPLQQQVQQNAANLQMPGQYSQATQFANAAGLGGMQSAQQALGYGNAGFQSGQKGQQLGLMAAQNANRQAMQAQNAAYGYGNMGAQAGLQGQQSGLMGQDIGMQGGQYYGGMGAGYGAQAAGMAPQAQMYGKNAANIGEMALDAQKYGSKIGSQAEQYAQQAARAGSDYGYLMRSPQLMQQYMSPYQSAVTDVQLQGLQRQADIAAQGRKASAARAGAFGGSRQAIENAEANRALQSQMDAVRAQGLQSAYDKAQQAIQAGMGYELQGVGAANQSLGTALQGGQLGLSGIGQAMAGQQAGLQGLSTANQLYGSGMQGAQVGLSGIDRSLAGTAQGMQGAQAAMQGAGVGLSGVGQAINAGQLGLQGAGVGLQGTAQGMQGAQAGLQGVSGAQAGYGLGNQSAGILGTLGNQQLAAQQGILGLQNQIGGQQQQQQQQIINQAIQNYAQAQEAPMTAFNQYNALLRGYALPGTTTSQYQAAPSLASQVGGLGMTGIAGMGLYNAMNKG
jgi:hypothetical protein